MILCTISGTWVQRCLDTEPRTWIGQPNNGGPHNHRSGRSGGCNAWSVPVRELVSIFYEKFWNEISLGIAEEILHPEVTFRGSVGLGATGRREVCDYVLMVTSALSDYRCDIVELTAEEMRASAKVRFSGVHMGEFLGFPPTGRRVEWMGAAFFAADEGMLRDIWVLGDLDSLRSQLGLWASPGH